MKKMNRCQVTDCKNQSSVNKQNAVVCSKHSKQRLQWRIKPQMNIPGDLYHKDYKYIICMFDEDYFDHVTLLLFMHFRNLKIFVPWKIFDIILQYSFENILVCDFVDENYGYGWSAFPIEQYVYEFFPENDTNKNYDSIIWTIEYPYTLILRTTTKMSKRELLKLGCKWVGQPVNNKFLEMLGCIWDGDPKTIAGFSRYKDYKEKPKTIDGLSCYPYYEGHHCSESYIYLDFGS